MTVAIFKRMSMPLVVVMLAVLSGSLYKGSLPFGSVCFVVIFLALGFIRSRFEQTLGRSGEASDTLESLLLLAVFLGMGPTTMLYIATPWFAFADYSLPIVISVCAVLLGAFALFVFYRSHVDLGRQWSVSLAIQDKHELIDHGVYRHVRHPMYAALFLIVIAQAGLLANWFAGFAGLVAFALLYLLRVKREEALMAAQFGEAWHAYTARTPRLVPAFWRR
ncbi:MAG: protein-S-isoprenylcysteine O-methyltransferase [Pseudomonadota bacterium]